MSIHLVFILFICIHVEPEISEFLPVIPLNQTLLAICVYFQYPLVFRFFPLDIIFPKIYYPLFTQLLNSALNLRIKKDEVHSSFSTY